MKQDFPDGPMSPEQQAFHFEEFKQLKAEISTMLQRIENLIKLGVFSGTAIYTWIIVHFAKKAPLDGDLLVIAVCLPPALLFFCACLSASSYYHISLIAEYIRQLEKKMGFASHGWETFWKKERQQMKSMLLVFLFALLLLEVASSFLLYQKLTRGG